MTVKPNATLDVASNEREARLRERIRDRLHVDLPDPETDMLESGLIDSLAFVELLMIIENEFGVHTEVDDLDMDNFRTLQRIGAFIESRSVSSGRASE